MISTSFITMHFIFIILSITIAAHEIFNIPDNNTTPDDTPHDAEQNDSDVGDISTKIIGGTDVPPGSYPWFARAVSYMEGKGWKWFGCGGSLVSPEFVLTAAHCINFDFERNGGYQVGALCEPFTANDNCGQSKIETVKVRMSNI